MKVELLNATNEKLVELAIRICRGRKEESLDGPVNEGLIRRVIDSGHESVAEHASFTFRITDISRVTTHQLVRHRIASFSQESQRYSDPLIVEGDWAVIPDTVLQNAEAKKLAEEFLEQAKVLRKKFDRLGIDLEDSRYFLPNACKTAIIMTMNARSLWNFFDFRICSNAQWEIRRLAKMIFHLLKEEAPTLFAWWKPRCGRGCPEKCDKPVSLKLDEGTIINGRTIEYKQKS